MRGLFPTKFERVIGKMIFALFALLFFLDREQDLATALMWTVCVLVAEAIGERLFMSAMFSSGLRRLYITVVILGPLRRKGILPARGKGTDEDVRRLAESGYQRYAIPLYMQIHNASLHEAKKALNQMATN